MKSIEIRLATCALVRTRFVGRAALERHASRDGVALAELEVRLGLATEAELALARMVATSEHHAARARATPLRAAEERYLLLERVALAHYERCDRARTWRDAATQVGALHLTGGARVSPTSRVVYPIRDVRTPPLGERLAAYKAVRAAERDAAALVAVAPDVRDAYERCAYRVAYGRWAGGEHTTTIAVGSPHVSCSTRRVWSSNRKWSGLDSAHTITVHADYLDRVPADARVVDELLTLDCDPPLIVGSRIRAATWVAQGRGTGIETVRGLLVRTATGYAHARTLRSAQQIARQAEIETAVDAARAS